MGRGGREDRGESVSILPEAKPSLYFITQKYSHELRHDSPHLYCIHLHFLNYVKRVLYFAYARILNILIKVGWSLHICVIAVQYSV